MSTGAIIGLVVAVLGGAGGPRLPGSRPAWQRKRLRRIRFGPEYDRTLEQSDSRTAAEKELAERERAHSEFDLKPLSTTAQESYRARHLGRCAGQVRRLAEHGDRDADRLVTEPIMSERGFPTRRFRRR